MVASPSYLNCLMKITIAVNIKITEIIVPKFAILARYAS
jgi:hypothetical protein